MKTTVVKKQIVPEDVGLSAWFPLHPSDVDFINKFGDGEPFQTDIKRDRFYPLTQKYWALCNLIAQNHKVDPALDFLNTKNIVDEYLKLKLNCIESRMVFPDGTVHVRTGSISNRAKDQDEFQKYYDAAIQIMSEISGISVFDLEENWMDYETGVE